MSGVFTPQNLRSAIDAANGIVNPPRQFDHLMSLVNKAFAQLTINQDGSPARSITRLAKDEVQVLVTIVDSCLELRIDLSRPEIYQAAITYYPKPTLTEIAISKLMFQLITQLTNAGWCMHKYSVRKDGAESDDYLFGVNFYVERDKG